MQAIGRYRLVREVARGATGAVHRALGPDDRTVALKLLLSGRSATAMQRRRFANEVQALLRIRHPHVVGLLDAGEHEGTPFLVMEWVEGETLAARLHRTGVLEPRAAAELGLLLAGALDHCHRQGILHRDLKPENVLLRATPEDPSGLERPLLTDFGLAKDLLPEAGEVTHGSVQGALLGTPGYWPPEQARGQLAAIGPCSDVYGLCALVWAAIVGRPPQSGANLQALLRELEAPPIPPGTLVPGVPGWLDELLVRGLDPLPARRPASAAELATALEAGLARPARARTGGTVMLSLALLLAGSGVAAGVLLWPPAAASSGVAAVASNPAPPPATASVAPPSTGAPSPGEKAAGLAARGLERFQADDLAGAREECDRALAADPELAEAHLLDAALRARAEGVTVAQVRAAIAIVDRVIDRHPAHAHAHHVRADLRDQIDDAEGRQRDLVRSLELDPRVLEVVVHLVELHRERGENAPALALLDRYLALEPRDPDALRSRGALRDEAGDRTGARKDLDLAVALAPGRAEMWISRADLAEEGDDIAAALRDCERAQELDPRSSEAWAVSARLRVEGGDMAGGERDLGRAIDLGPDRAELWYSRGLLRRTRGAPEARADFDRAILLEPDHADALLERATLRRAARDLPGARDDYSQLIQARPKNLSAWVGRATVRLELGDLHGALADADRSIELAPRTVEAWILRARTLESGENLTGALAAWDRALECGGHEAQLLLRRAMVKQKQRDLAGARADLERALSLPWPDHAEADKERAQRALEELR